MRVVMFYHSLLSDWNHGNAHFLRGVASELLARGHEVRVYEPRDSWSLQNLIAEQGEHGLAGFHAAYPALTSIRYEPAALNLDETLDRTDLVLVHEWNTPDLVRRLGQHRARRGGYRLLFHDTHHRSVTDPKRMAVYDLRHYDGVLAYGQAIGALYRSRGWAQRVWIWHEAADTRVFHPRSSQPCEGDVVWIGNWGDEERTAELRQFLLNPIRELGLKARVYGVRYPDHARKALAEAGCDYAGWLPNYEVPAVFARFKVTVHVPRRPYAHLLPGIPTIRVFEALACGIPLVCSHWEDTEGLFTPGRDFLMAQDGQEMKRHLQTLLQDEERAQQLAQHGQHTILARHTCRQRVDDLLAIDAELQGKRRASA